MSISFLWILAILTIGLTLSWKTSGQTGETLASFSTEGHTAYHLRAAALVGGQRGIVAAAYDGAVLAFTSQGQTLIDPGYLDPADRDATIVLQHLDGVACRDILSGENLPMDGGRIGLRIPAGTLRLMDIEHR